MKKVKEVRLVKYRKEKPPECMGIDGWWINDWFGKRVAWVKDEKWADHLLEQMHLAEKDVKLYEVIAEEKLVNLNTYLIEATGEPEALYAQRLELTDPKQSKVRSRTVLPLAVEEQ